MSEDICNTSMHRNWANAAAQALIREQGDFLVSGSIPRECQSLTAGHQADCCRVVTHVGATIEGLHSHLASHERLPLAEDLDCWEGMIMQARS